MASETIKIEFELPKEGESVARAMLEKYGIASREQPKTKGWSIP